MTGVKATSTKNSRIRAPLSSRQHKLAFLPRNSNSLVLKEKEGKSVTQPLGKNSRATPLYLMVGQVKKSGTGKEGPAASNIASIRLQLKGFQPFNASHLEIQGQHINYPIVILLCYLASKSV
eukprot:1159622-Pelagomonas_calceolata.AAC.11